MAESKKTEVITVKVVLNEEHKGIELTFSAKPEARFLAELKENGFKWHNQRKLWYAKQSEKTIALAGKFNRKWFNAYMSKQNKSAETDKATETAKAAVSKAKSKNSKSEATA